MLWLIPLVVLAIATAASIALSLRVHREVRVLTRRNTRKIETLTVALEKLADAQDRPSPPSSHREVGKIHRLEALRLLRRGESPAHVAAALGMLPAEIELLVRVQKLSATGPQHRHSA